MLAEVILRNPAKVLAVKAADFAPSLSVHILIEDS